MAIDANILLRGIVPDVAAAADRGFSLGQKIRNAPILRQQAKQNLAINEQNLGLNDQKIATGRREAIGSASDAVFGLFPDGITEESLQTTDPEVLKQIMPNGVNQQSIQQLNQLQQFGARRAQAGQREGFASAKTKVYQNGTVLTVLPDKSVEVTVAGQKVTDPTEIKAALQAANDNEIKFTQDKARAGSSGSVLGRGDTSDIEAATQDELVRAEAQGRAAIKESEKAFDSAANLEGKINIYDEAITALKGGANPGFINSYLPSFKKETLQLQEAIRKAGLNTISGVTLGAISKAELDLALGFDINEKMNNADLLEHLQDKKAAQTKVAAELKRYATFLADGGTRAKWNRKQTDMGNTGVKLNKNSIPDAPSPEETSGTFKSKGGITFKVK